MNEWVRKHRVGPQTWGLREDARRRQEDPVINDLVIRPGRYYCRDQDPLYRLLSTAEGLFVSDSSQDIPKVSDNKENSNLGPASRPRGKLSLVDLFSPNSPSPARTSAPPSGVPFMLAVLPKQPTREGFRPWLKAGRIKAFLLRFRIRDYVEIMNKWRALELTSENFKSQNLISAITCIQLGAGFCICAYLSAAWDIEQFWTVRPRSKVKAVQRSAELRSRRENPTQPLPLGRASVISISQLEQVRLH